MLEDSRVYMHRMSSPVTPNITHNYETPVQPTPSIMNELEDAIITDLQVCPAAPIQWSSLGLFSRFALAMISRFVMVVFSHAIFPSNGGRARTFRRDPSRGHVHAWRHRSRQRSLKRRMIVITRIAV